MNVYTCVSKKRELVDSTSRWSWIVGISKADSFLKFG